MSFFKNIANSINSIDKNKAVAAFSGAYTGAMGGFIALGIASGMGAPASIALAVTSVKGGRMASSLLASGYFYAKSKNTSDIQRAQEALKDAQEFRKDFLGTFNGFAIDNLGNQKISDIKQIYDNIKDLHSAGQGDTLGEKLKNITREIPTVFAKQFDQADTIGYEQLARKTLIENTQSENEESQGGDDLLEEEKEESNEESQEEDDLLENETYEDTQLDEDEDQM